MTLLLAILPVLVLIVVMTSPWPRRVFPWPAQVALPVAAGLAYLIQWTPWFAGGDPARRVHAAVIEGLLSALTPLGIVLGAIFFFRTMDRSGQLSVLTGAVRRLSPDPVAQLLLIGWSFSFLIEGLSGFGTPAALAAPLLVGLGFPAVRVAAMCLVMNSVPVTFGAVGTPVWFGLSGLGLTDGEMATLRWQAAVVNVAAAAVVPVVAMGLVVPLREVGRRWGYVAAVLAATMLPYLLLALVSPEFPSIVGGACGLAAGAALAKVGWGLPKSADAAGPPEEPDADKTSPDDERVTAMAPLGPAGAAPGSVWRAAVPVLAVVALLGVTRVDALGLKGFLRSETPAVSVGLGALGEAYLSASGVVGLRGILGTATNWKMELLYVPFILPFVVMAVGAALWLRMPRRELAAAWRETLQRLSKAAVALLGALVLVKLLMSGGETSAVRVLGEGLASGAGGAWPVVAPLLGALGAFFAGSATVSNLTFGGVQQSVAGVLGLPTPTVLALQTVGASLGNMVCVHNIVAVAAVLGIGEKRGPAAGTPGEDGSVGGILRLTAGPALLYSAVAGAGGALLVWGPG
ncbi:MAG: L-lactate permease [Tepidisphaerales bacterium]